MKKFILKLKSQVYRYTGIYLAEKEENEFLTSDAFWENFEKAIGSSKKNITSDYFKTIQGVYLGIWQSGNGFTRLFNHFAYKPGIVNKIISFFYVPVFTLKWDLEMILLSIKERFRPEVSPRLKQSTKQKPKPKRKSNAKRNKR